MRQTNLFLRRLKRGMVAKVLLGQSDRQLVEQFLSSHDEAIFEALIRRHGPMVQRVCWRILQQTQDAEDAFQSTFLLLAQKLHTVRKHASLASWLHGVARRVALKARARAAMRRRHEWAAHTSRDVPPDDMTWKELRGILDAELARLPEKWRQPLILCYLEGRTQDEAARQLGWTRTTLQRRLAEARATLGQRLRWQGVTGPAALAAVLVCDCTQAAGLPRTLIDSTVQAAACLAAGQTAAVTVPANVAALTNAIAKGMFMSKRIVIAASLVLATTLLCGAWLIATPQLAVRAQAAVPQGTERPGPGTSERPQGFTVDGIAGKIAWSRDGKLLALASFILEKDGDSEVDTTTVRIWDARKRKFTLSQGAEQKTRVRSLAFSPDGRLLAIGINKPTMTDADEVRLIDVSTGTLNQAIPFKGVLGGLAFSADGKRLAFGGKILNPTEPGRVEITLWDVRKGAVGSTIERPLVDKGEFQDSGLTCLAFSPDGAVLVAAETDCTLRLWDTETGKLRRTLEGHTDRIWDVAFAPDGKTFVTASSDRTVRIWDTQTGKERRTLEGNKGRVYAIAYASDGKTIAAGGMLFDDKDTATGGEVVAWDAETGRLQHSLRSGIPLVHSIAFSPAGARSLAVATGTIRGGQASGGVRFLPLTSTAEKRK
jgi:RNA polymerase sigma factor (sigma-70 family)